MKECHKKDPDRAGRRLQKECTERVDSVQSYLPLTVVTYTLIGIYKIHKFVSLPECCNQLFDEEEPENEQ